MIGSEDFGEGLVRRGGVCRHGDRVTALEERSSVDELASAGADAWKRYSRWIPQEESDREIQHELRLSLPRVICFRFKLASVV